ncbi:MAG: helix-turn-helix domain-containing protein [Candidatus Woesearchaeota archaeon]
MWVAKVRLVHKDCITSQLTKKYGLTNLVYGLGYYEDKNFLYFNIMHIPRGEEKQKKAFMAEVRKDQRIIKFEQAGGMFFTLVREPKKNRYLIHFYNPKIFFLKPDVNTPDGHEIYEIGSWDKKGLQKFIHMTKEQMQGELLKLKQEKIADIFYPHITTRLTEKQMRAISLAESNGFYDYPRRANLDLLSRMMKVSKSTYQNHLRTAEKKLMPFLVGNARLINGY